MVVVIHTRPLPTLFFPWVRVAVPLFFVISSYLLFRRFNDTDESRKPELIKKYVKRILKLYCFWFVLLLPYTIVARREWMSSRAIGFIASLVKNFLLGSTFSGSWYYMASIWGVVIIFLTRRINPKVLAIIFASLYFLCCLRTGYYWVSGNDKVLRSILVNYELILLNPANSFSVAVFWMFIGKLIADYDVTIRNKMQIFCGIILSMMALWLEWKISISKGGSVCENNDCFVSLIPLCFFSFMLIVKSDKSIKSAKTLRILSIIIYSMHASITGATKYILATFFQIENEILLFLIVVIVCHVSAFLILKLERTKHFSFLKYSH